MAKFKVVNDAEYTKAVDQMDETNRATGFRVLGDDEQPGGFAFGNVPRRAVGRPDLSKLFGEEVGVQAERALGVKPYSPGIRGTLEAGYSPAALAFKGAGAIGQRVEAAEAELTDEVIMQYKRLFSGQGMDILSPLVRAKQGLVGQVPPLEFGDVSEKHVPIPKSLERYEDTIHATIGLAAAAMGDPIQVARKVGAPMIDIIRNFVAKNSETTYASLLKTMHRMDKHVIDYATKTNWRFVKKEFLDETGGSIRKYGNKLIHFWERKMRRPAGNLFEELAVNVPDTKISGEAGQGLGDMLARTLAQESDPAMEQAIRRAPIGRRGLPVTEKEVATYIERFSPDEAGELVLKSTTEAQGVKVGGRQRVITETFDAGGAPLGKVVKETTTTPEQAAKAADMTFDNLLGRLLAGQEVSVKELYTADRVLRSLDADKNIRAGRMVHDILAPILEKQIDGYGKARSAWMHTMVARDSMVDLFGPLDFKFTGAKRIPVFSEIRVDKFKGVLDNQPQAPGRLQLENLQRSFDGYFGSGKLNVAQPIMDRAAGQYMGDIHFRLSGLSAGGILGGAAVRMGAGNPAIMAAALGGLVTSVPRFAAKLGKYTFQQGSKRELVRSALYKSSTARRLIESPLMKESLRITGTAGASVTNQAVARLLLRDAPAVTADRF